MDRITAELLLGLKAPYGEDDIAAAYKRAIRDNHPDVLIAKGYSPQDANERAKQINIARDYLLDSNAEVEVGSGSTRGPASHPSANASGARGYGSDSYAAGSSSRQERSAWDNSSSQKGTARQETREKPSGQQRTHRAASAAGAGERASAGDGKRIDGFTPRAKKKTTVLAFASALIGVAGMVSALLIFPPIGSAMDVSREGGWLPIFMMAGPPVAVVCAIISRVRSAKGGGLRRVGLACAGLEYVYLAIWSWSLA